MRRDVETQTSFYLWFVRFGITLHVLHGREGFKPTHNPAEQRRDTHTHTHTRTHGGVRRLKLYLSQSKVGQVWNAEDEEEEAQSTQPDQACAHRSVFCRLCEKRKDQQTLNKKSRIVLMSPKNMQNFKLSFSGSAPQKYKRCDRIIWP